MEVISPLDREETDRKMSGVRVATEGAHVRMEAEAGVLRPQAKDTWGHQGAGGGREDPLTSRVLKGTNPANTLILDFWPPEL